MHTLTETLPLLHEPRLSFPMCNNNNNKNQIFPVGVCVTNIQGHHLQVTPYIVHTTYQPCSK